MASVKSHMIAKKKRRIQPKEGDVFRVDMGPGGEIFGRVARLLVTPGVEEAALLYFFEPSTSALLTSALLVPPKLVSPTIFNHGFFDVIENRPFAQGERYERHCLHDGMQQYFAEDGAKLEAPFEPLVFDVCDTIPTLDLALSRALGIPLAMPPIGADTESETKRPERGVQALNDEEIDAFWKTIENGRKTARGDCEKLVGAVESKLVRASRGAVASFARVLNHLLDRANTWDLWGAAFILNGGCSDDGFEYFRAWLITQGKDAFEAALARPEILAEVAKADEEHECEDLLYVAARVFEARFDASLETARAGGEPKGQPWKEEELPLRLPALWAWSKQ